MIVTKTKTCRGRFPCNLSLSLSLLHAHTQLNSQDSVAAYLHVTPFPAQIPKMERGYTLSFVICESMPLSPCLLHRSIVGRSSQATSSLKVKELDAAPRPPGPPPKILGDTSNLSAREHSRYRGAAGTADGGNYQRSRNLRQPSRSAA